MDVSSQFKARSPNVGEFLAIQGGILAGKELEKQAQTMGGTNGTLIKDAALVVGVIATNIAEGMLGSEAGKSAMGYIGQALTGAFAASIAQK